MTSQRQFSLWKSLPVFLLGHRRLVLLLFFLLTLLFARGIPRLYIDNSLEGLFLESDPDLGVLNATVQEYGTELGMVVAFRPGEVFRNEFLHLADRLTREILQVEGVDDVYSVTRMDHIEAEGAEIRVCPLVPDLPASPEKMREARKNALEDPFVTGQILSEDGSTAALVIQFTHNIGDVNKTLAAVDDIQGILREQVGSSCEYHVSGLVAITAFMNRYCLMDLVTFLPVGIAIVFVILLAVFRTLAAVLTTLGAILLSVVWTLGLMGLMNVPITVTTTMLPVLILVIGVSDAVHLITQYYEGIAGGRQREDALKNAVYKVGTPCFLTSVTTAMGFSSLLLSNLRPVRDFGLYAALGIFFAFLIFIFLVPVFLSFLAPPRSGAVERLRAGRTTRVMERIAALTERHPWPVLFLSVGIIGLAAFGIVRIRVDTNYYEYFYESDPIVRSIRFIDRNLTGIEPLRILLHTQEPDGVKDPAFLEKVDALESYLQAYPEVSRVFGLPDPLRRMNRLLNEDRPEYEVLPGSREAAAQYLLLLSLAGGDEMLGFLTNADYSSVQVVAMLRLVGTTREGEILRELRQYLKERFSPEVSFELTDAAVLNPTLAHHLVNSQFKTFFLAFMLIFGAMTFLFRSVRVGLLTIVPNVLPVLVTAGLMGFAGITLNVVTVMVASIAIGIAVDDTIHILTRYRIERLETRDPSEAMRHTLASSGRAVVFTSVVFTAGFMITFFSRFKLPCHFGILCASIMVGALVADLLLLPALLRLTRPFKRMHETPGA